VPFEYAFRKGYQKELELNRVNNLLDYADYINVAYWEKCRYLKELHRNYSISQEIN
jgi:hypothetical protein